jgi:hypothetical protein
VEQSEHGNDRFRSRLVGKLAQCCAVSAVVIANASICAPAALARSDSSCLGAGPASAHTALVFQTGPCTSSRVILQAYSAFNQAYRKYYADMDAEKAQAEVWGRLFQAEQACLGNEPPIDYVSEVPAAVTRERAELNKLALDYDAMKRANHFGNATVTARIAAALKTLDADLATDFQVTTRELTAATFYRAGDCVDGSEEWGALQSVANGTVVSVNDALGQISSALEDLKSCKGELVELAPLTPAQINHQAGGGGTERAGSGGLSVLAPRSLKLKGNGHGPLPLTLTAPATGTFEIALRHGQKLILGVFGTTTAGAGGIRLNLAAAPLGVSQLTITFMRGLAGEGMAGNPVTITLRIRLVR